MDELFRVVSNASRTLRLTNGGYEETPYEKFGTRIARSGPAGQAQCSGEDSGSL